MFLNRVIKMGDKAQLTRNYLADWISDVKYSNVESSVTRHGTQVFFRTCFNARRSVV